MFIEKKDLEKREWKLKGLGDGNFTTSITHFLALKVQILMLSLRDVDVTISRNLV